MKSSRHLALVAWVTGDLEKACQSYELWAQTYPRDLIPPTNLYQIDIILGQYDKALPEAREALRLEPASGKRGQFRRLCQYTR